jgi:glycosyltransferase involved in cell wall biosynthesis
MSPYRLAYLADASSIHTQRWVAHFARLGYDTHVFSFLPGEIPGATIHRLDAGTVQHEGGNWRYLLQLPALRRQIHRLQPDLLHAHYLTSYGLLGAMVGMHPLMLTALGSDVLVTPQRSRLYHLLLRITLARADSITSDAETMSQRILRYGVPAERLLTVPLGVNLHLFNAMGRDWPDCGGQLISTRHLLPNTNLQTVLRAVAQARDKIDGLHLAVVGEGPERPRLQALARQVSLDRSVTWQGAVEHEHLPAFLRQADLYLAVTLSDSTSVSLLEAMACGALPIVSDLHANREWIEPGINGLLVPPNDAQSLAEALVRAARSPALRQQAARHNAHLITERADWQKNMDQVEAAYRALIREHDRP